MPEFGTVGGQFETMIVDLADPGAEPDLIVLTGTITFTLNVPRLVYATASPNPLVIATKPFVGMLDAEGYLCAPNAQNLPGARDLVVIATDDSTSNPTDTQYRVDYDLKGPGGYAFALPSHTLSVPAGTRVDLALVIPPAASVPMGIAAAEAAAAIAAAAALAAQSVVAGFIVLGPTDEVPPGTPAGTVILRTLADPTP